MIENFFNDAQLFYMGVSAIFAAILVLIFWRRAHMNPRGRMVIGLGLAPTPIVTLALSTLMTGGSDPIVLLRVFVMGASVLSVFRLIFVLLAGIVSALIVAKFLARQIDQVTMVGHSNR